MAAPRNKVDLRKSIRKAAKTVLSKRRVLRDVPTVPTQQQIEQSINLGKTLPLSEFVKSLNKNIKL